MQPLVHSAVLVLAALHHVQCYLQPAPVSIIEPDPTEYLDYLPKDLGILVMLTPTKNIR